jgi:hypothetical protein
MKKNIFTNLLRVVFSMIFLLSSIQPGVVNAKSYKHVKAYLTNNSSKERIELPVEIKMNENGHDITYEVIVMSGSLSESHSWLDTTDSARLTITQYFDKKTIGYKTYVALDRSVAKWEKLSSQITIKNAKVGSKVYGYKESGAFINKNETKLVGTPVNNTWYTHTPSWKGIWMLVDFFGFQISNASSTIVRGGSSWTMEFCVAQGGDTSCE